MLGKLRVEPGSLAELSKRKTDGRGELAGKAEAEQELAKLIAELSLLHNRLYAEASRSVLLILQGLDASG
jgi:polyphosphate kinase 2 (PPK2 family)